MEINPKLTEKGQRDFQLVRHAVDLGDQKAYAELMDHYHDSLYYMLLKMTNNTRDAEDLTIEAFGKAFKNLHQYTPDYAFSTWLFKIASNNCIDFIRKKKKNTFSMNGYYGENETDELANIIPSKLLSPVDRVIRKQKMEVMRDVVGKLKPHYKKLVELRYFKEYSYEEIATELDLPLGTVKAQLFRAREFLFNILKNVQERI
jgi:RNA polymerase sigma-70 factor, ECF subfamily